MNAKQQNDYLFVTKFNTPLNSVIYSDAIKAVIRQINLTRPFDNQLSLKMTMDLYTHVTEEKSVTDIEKIVSGNKNNVVDIRRKMA